MYDNKNSKIKTKIANHSFMLFVWCFVLIVIAAIAVADIGQGRTEAGTSESLSAIEVDVGGGQADASTGEKIRLFKSKDEEGEIFGMCSFNQSLLRLVKEGKVSQEVATSFADNKDEFMLMVKGIR